MKFPTSCNKKHSFERANSKRDVHSGLGCVISNVYCFGSSRETLNGE